MSFFVSDWTRIEKKLLAKKLGEDEPFAVYPFRVKQAERYATSIEGEFSLDKFKLYLENHNKVFKAKREKRLIVNQKEELKKKIEDLEKNELTITSKYPEVFNEKEETLRISKSITSAEKKFLTIWNQYYEYCKDEKKESTWSRIPNNLTILKAYCTYSGTPLTFENLNSDFGRNFKQYLLNEHVNYITDKKGVKNGTVHNIQKSISTFLNWAFKNNLQTSLEFKKWETKKPKTDLQYLQEWQLVELFQKELAPGSSYEKTRDAWLIMAYSCMRISDLKEASTVGDAFINYATECIEYTSVKSKKKCCVPYGNNPILKSLLEKYNYNFPYHTSINENIKEIVRNFEWGKKTTIREEEIGKKVVKLSKPLCEFITCHSARRSGINLYIMHNCTIHALSVLCGNDVASLQIYFKKDNRLIIDTVNKISFQSKVLEVA